MLRPSDFDTIQGYSQWKDLNRTDTYYILSALDAPLEPIDEEVGKILVSITVRDAVGLMAKDKNGSSNPYAVISTADGRLFKSSVISRSLNPTFNLHVSL